MSDKEKIYQLLQSQDKSNVELAFSLDKTYGWGVKEELSERYKRILKWYRIEELFTNPNLRHYIEILDREDHHNHEIIMDNSYTIRWKANEYVRISQRNISLNDLCPLLTYLGYGKNSEVYRKLYRDLGYSLSGYWEVFYWEANNEKADEYRKI